MKPLHFFPACTLLAALALNACDKGNSPAGQRGPQADFTSTITRASGSAWAANDKIGIFMVGAGTATVAEAASNKPYTTTTGNGTFTATGGDRIYFPVTGNVDFLAYYPYAASLTGFTYPIDVSVQASFPAIDLMWAKTAGKNKTAPAVALGFTHKLSKLVFKTLPGAGLTAADLAAMTVTVKGMATKSTFDVSSGTQGANTATAPIALKTVTAGSEYQAIVLPGAVAAGTVTVEFALGATGDPFVWNVPAMTFAAGNEYEYTVTLSRTQVNVTGTINPWGTGDPGTGTAE